MIKLKDLLTELDILDQGFLRAKSCKLKTENTETNTFQMYHGGKRWSGLPSEILPSEKGRYEGGVGIYFTNKYETAVKYGRGSRVVHIVDIDKNYKDLEDVDISLDNLVNFVKNVYGLRKKKEIIEDMVNYSKRTNKTNIPAEVLNNLIVNYEAGAGKVGVEITKYFVSNGIDASLQHQSGGEEWLVVFNPKIIKKVSVVDPKMVKNDFEWMLPKCKEVKRSEC